MLTERQVTKVKRIIKETIIDKYFFKQWYEKISIDYAYSTKNKRKKEFMHLIDKMCNFYNYDEYKNLNKKIKALAKKYNCNENDLEYGEYEEEIV